MTRVLVGPFGAIVRAGLDDLLRHPKLHVFHADAGDLWARLLTELPDVVLLDLDAPGTRDIARRIATEFPALTVVACSSVDPTMRIYPRFHHGESYTRSLGADSSLTEAVGG
jgi:DNA-binding NarL/FixJ family response regulator